MKKFLSVILALLISLPLLSFQAGAEEITAFSENFEDDEGPKGWTFIDADGDGENWYTYLYSSEHAHSGDYFLTSASYVNEFGPLTPDNWAITPAIVIPKDAVLSFWIRAMDRFYSGDILSVYIGDSADPDGMVQLGSDLTGTAEYAEYTYDLSEYAGQTKYIGFRHHDVTNMFMIDLDDVVVSGSVSADPGFKCCTLLLTGQIGVNFYADLSGLAEAEREAVTVEFSVNGVTSTDTFDAACTDPDGNGYFGFTCFVNSIEMADRITATLYYGEDGEVSTEYSVQEYVDYVLDNTDDFSANTVALVGAIADYGHYAQLYFEEIRDWTLGVDHDAMPAVNELGADDVAAAREATADAVAGFVPGDSAIEGAGFSLGLDSETTIRIYLTLADGFAGDVAAACGDESLGCEILESGRYLIEIPGIPAYALDNTYSITVTAGGDAVISVSPLSYVRAVLTSESGDAAQLAATALYRYCAAASAYVLNPNG